MSHILDVSVVTVGRLDDDDHGSHDIRDGRIEVDDTETARALYERYRMLSWHGDEPEAESGPVSEGETGGSDAEDGGAEDSTDAEAPFDPSEFTVAELRDQLTGDESDAEREALADAERDGKNRSSAIDILEP